MEKDLAPGQFDGAERQRGAAQQGQPLRDHADHCGNHGFDAVPKGCAGQKIALREKRRADGKNSDSSDQNNAVDVTNHLRLLFAAEFFGFLDQAGGVGVISHLC